MHVSGIFLDLSSIFQLVLTVLVVGFGLLHLVKKTASKYFVVDANFEGSAAVDAVDRRGRDRMAVAADSCFVCGILAKKKCSRCKAVWYCSLECQSKHWKDHKLKCKELKLVDNEKSMPSASSSCKRRKPSGWWAENASSSLSLVPARGICKVLEQPKKVLFPYDEFVKLFNWDKPGFPPCGLLNCGNSCFANVVLQCLACTRPLIAYLLEKGHTNECKRNDWCFLCELQLHVCRVSQSLNPFSPINILSRLPNIGGNLGYGKQEDAHEFMRFAIDTMQSVCLDEFGGEKALNPSTQETTLIQHIFGGYLQSQVKCSKCNQISNRYENMMDLTVEIQGDAASLEDCLDQFTVKEWLDGENMYKCDGCNDYVKAWKRLTVHQAPNILTVALKRFQSGRFGKLNKRVTFPETLDLGPYMSEAGGGTHLYRLYAVVVHVDMLNASYFGHYICYTKDFCGNWYRIDDCKVMKVEVEEVLAQGAYMLLYSRICVRQPCVKPLEPTRKEEERQTMEVVHEALKCGIEPVESSSIGESTESFSSRECPSSDIHLQSTDSSRGRELSIRTEYESNGEDLEDVDLNDPIKVNSDPIRKELEDVDMSNPESRSVVSKDLEEWDLSDHSHALKTVLPANILHRDKHGESADSVMSSELSVESHTVESQESGTNSTVDCSFEEEDSLRSNQDKEPQLPNPSPDDSLSSINIVHQITDRPKASSNVSIALKSEMEPPDEAGLSHSPLDFRLEQAMATNNPSVSNIGITKSGKVSLANGNVEAKASLVAGDNCSSGGQLKTLFSPGFLDKPTRRKSLHKDKKAQIETGEIGPSSMVNSNCNGVAGSLHSVRSNGKLYHHDESAETFHGDRNGNGNGNGNIHIFDHKKPLISPGFLDKPSMRKSLNKEEVAKKEVAEVVHPCNTDCNGFCVPVFSDQNGSKINYQEDARLETLCGAGTDLVLDCKPLLSSGFLNKRTGKKALIKDAEAHEMEQGNHLSKLETNCNESTDSIFGNQNGNEYRANGISASLCESGEEIVLDVDKSLLAPGFFDKPSKMKLRNEAEIAQKELGGVGQSEVSKH